MSAVQDLFAQGSHAFADEDYELALDLYSQAIALNSSHPEIFLKRSTTYQKLGKDQEAYEDAIKALTLVQEKPSADKDVEAKALLRKGVAAYHLQDYATAKAALEACHIINPELRTLSQWMRKVDQEYAKLPKPAVTTEAAAAPAASIATSTPAAPAAVPAAAASEKSASAPIASPAAIAAAAAQPTTPAVHRVRHEWYQNDSFVTISVFIKNAKKDSVDVQITERALSVSVKMPTGSDYSLELDPLSHEVVPAESQFEVLSTKIEIRLKKQRIAVKWGALEGDDTNAGSMATMASAATPAYPSSSRRGPKDWDALDREAAKDEDKADGDKALNQLFSQIYKDADDDTKRAMMKSFTESNGTCLSTNWAEVSKGTVETRPPEGMVAKKY
ncbi:Protein SGT1 A [Actinomortierella ambigua]|nr:Protein SGT1 A [Actinomortierella ambigua]